MTRKGDTVLVAALKRYGKKIEKYIQNSLNKTMKVKVLVEDARDSQGKASGAAYLEIEIDKKDGWGGENQVEIHGTIGFDKSGKKGKKEDEAYLDGVTVGDWDVGSRAIGLTGCSIGEFLVHMFTLFAIKAGNESVLLDNAAGPRGEHIYRQVGFIKSKGERAQYGDDNEMIFPLTGKKKNKDAGQLWRERYNKFRKKLKTKIKNNENCKSFWKSVPTALEAPGPVHTLARGSKRRTRRKKGGNGKDNKTKKKTTRCTGIKKAFGQCMKAANTTAFNKRVISAQDTSLGQPTTQFAPMLMGYPSGRGGGRKKRGGSPKFLCGPDKDFVPEAHFARLEGIFDKLKKDTTGGPLEEIVDELPLIKKNKGECYNCKKLIDKLVEDTMPSFVGPKILPIKNDDILWLQQFTGVHKGRMCTIMGGRKRRGGYGPPITPEQARRMWIRDDRRREEQRRLQIQQALARSELSAAGPGYSVTNQPIEETKRSKALRKIQENNQKIIANRKHRKVEEPKKFTEEELSQIQFEPTHLKKNQIGIVNPDGSLAVASKIKVPFRTRILRNITRKFKKKLAERKRKTRVAPMPPVGGKKTKRHRKKYKKTRRR